MGEGEGRTQILQVDAAEPAPEAIERAAELIRRGRLVAFPTETVYGLGADALNPQAVARIFAAKERPPQDPIIVHVSEAAELERVARQVPPMAWSLVERFWPGPLTLVLPRAQAVPDVVTAGGDTVGVRCPRHAVALALIRAARTPIAAPSANRFGRTSPTSAEHVLQDLGGRFDLLLDSGPTPVGVESTVLDLTRPQPAILRPGGVPREALEEILGPVELAARAGPADQALPSPGLLRSHYAPQAKMLLFVGPRPRMLEALRGQARELLAQGKRVGVLLAQEDLPFLEGEGVVAQSLGPEGDLERVARNLFTAMRILDALGVEVILARDFGAAGLGLAVRDRLTRAAGGRVVKVD